MHDSPQQQAEIYWIDRTDDVRTTLIAANAHSLTEGEWLAPLSMGCAPIGLRECDLIPCKPFAEMSVENTSGADVDSPLLGIGLARDGATLMQKRALRTAVPPLFAGRSVRPPLRGDGSPRSPLILSNDFDLRLLQATERDQWFDMLLGGEQLLLRGFSGLPGVALLRMPLLRVVATVGGRRFALTPDTVRVDLATRTVLVVSRATLPSSLRLEAEPGAWTPRIAPAPGRPGYLRSPPAWSFAAGARRQSRPSPTVDPIRLDSLDGFTVGSTRWFAAPDRHERAIIVKRAYSIVGGALVPLEGASLAADRLVDEDDPLSPLMIASDFAPKKPLVDVLVRGTAYARPGAEHALVRLSLADIDHAVVALPPRRWGTDGIPTASAPFEPVPLSWKEAFGGERSAANPSGTGHGGEGSPPRIESPERLLRSRGDEVDPAGFGPLAPTSYRRRRYLGTLDERWRQTRWPAMPVDFDEAFFQAAPPGCRARAVAPGARVTISGVSPEGEGLSFELPSSTPAVLVGFGTGAPTPLPVQLDTITIDTDALTVELVWRGRYPIAQRPREPERVLVSGSHAGEQAFMLAFDDAWDDKARVSDDSVPVLAREALQRLTATPHDIVDRSPKSLSTPTASSLTALVAKGGSVAGRDFSECDLTGIDLSGADLTGLLLRGAQLSGADLSRAILKGADLSGARAVGARFDEADLDSADFTQAVLDGASFQSARLHRTSFAFARMHGCSLKGARGSSTSFFGAALRDACADGSELRKVDLSRTLLNESSFHAARLVDAKLYECEAERASFGGADLAHARLELMRATDASFRGVTAPDSNWERATLVRCDLAESVLDGAIFAGADLSECDLRKVRAPRASFTEGVLSGTRLEGATLSGCSFEAADLSGATLSGADLRDADMWLARVELADLEQAALVTQGASLAHGGLGKPSRPER